MLWVAAHRSKRLAIPGVIDWGKEVSIIDSLKAALATFGGNKRPLDFSEAARRKWQQWYDGLDDQKTGLIDNILARAEAHVLRLAMIYAVLDNVAGINEQHLRAAIAVWEYCERSAKWIFGNRTGDRIADKILFALERAVGGLSRKAITTGVFNKNVHKVDIDRALELLLNARLANFAKIKTEGAEKPTEVWYVPEFEDTVTLEEPEISL
jgi:Protein of unknown function (DUF3987)